MYRLWTVSQYLRARRGELTNRKASIDADKCVGCGRCIGVCPTDAVQPQYDEAFDVMNKKIAEYTKAVIHGKPHFHISLVIDVSPYCDCHAENDVPLVPDVGMFASFDPVALDIACADAVNRQPLCGAVCLTQALTQRTATTLRRLFPIQTGMHVRTTPQKSASAAKNMS